MFQKYLLAFLVSMVPLIELRGGVPFATAMGIDFWPALIVCVLGNMLPVPIIYFFARKVLLWDGELFIQPTGMSATNLFLLKTLIDIEYELIKEGESYD